MLIYYITCGLIGVANVIIWGAYGDLLVERFDYFKILRSILLALAWGFFLFISNPNLPLLIVCLLVLSLERTTTEIYKMFIRVEDQSKYKIPSNIIKWDHRLRKLIGVILIAALVVGLHFFDLSINKIILIVAIGMIIALCGMLKDAPFEGFDGLKFFRSPVISMIVGALIILAFPTLAGKYVLFATACAERIVSEFYKKILNGRIPGKFKLVAFNKMWQENRKYLLYVYALDIIGIAIIAFI